MIPEGFAETLSRERRPGLEGFRVGTRVQIPVPRGQEGVRPQGRPMLLADLAGDSDENVLSLVDDRAKRIEGDRPYHDDVPSSPWTLSLPSPPEVAQKTDRTFVARRRRAAQRLRVGDEERVVLPVHREVSRHAGFEVLLDVVVRVRVEETDSPTNSNRVRVDEEDGMAARVEEDGIRRLWAHAVLCEQVVSDYVRRSIEISRQVAIRSIQQVAAEVTEPFRFGPIQARDFHVSPNDRHRGRRKRAHLEEARLLQVLHRLGDIP